MRWLFAHGYIPPSSYGRFVLNEAVGVERGKHGGEDDEDINELS